MEYVSAIMLDFDNIYGSLFRQSVRAAKRFARDPALWLEPLKEMQSTESETSIHNFVVRRCYMNPAGIISSDSEYFSSFRQNFVREGWEVIDTPPLTVRGKTSADIHIVMDVMDIVQQYPHVREYVLMAADADYTPLVIRLRKHMKKTIVYAASNMAVAYRASCDSVIEEADIIALLNEDDIQKTMPLAVRKLDATDAVGFSVPVKVTLDEVTDTLNRHFDESGDNYNCGIASVGHLLMRAHGKDVAKDWLSHNSLSELLRNVKGFELVRKSGGDLDLRRILSHLP